MSALRSSKFHLDCMLAIQLTFSSSLALVAVLDLCATVILNLHILLFAAISLVIGLVADIKIVALVQLCAFLGISI